MSPSYPSSYPHGANCIYLVSLPSGVYVNISFLHMDIVCEEIYSTSDYIEFRDGSSKEAPVMGRFCGNGSNLPQFMHTTQNNLWIKWACMIWKWLSLKPYNSFCRFHSNHFVDGLGFQLRYESSNVSHWIYNGGGCGHSFTTPNGLLTSPSFPNYYPNNANCHYTITQPIGSGILLSFINMEIKCIEAENSDYLSIYDNIFDGTTTYSSPILDKFCSHRITSATQQRTITIPPPIQSSSNHVRIMWEPLLTPKGVNKWRNHYFQIPFQCVWTTSGISTALPRLASFHKLWWKVIKF